MLCERQFPSEIILAKHIAQSDLHKARLFHHACGYIEHYADCSVFIMHPIPLLHAWPIQTNLANPETVEKGKSRKHAADPGYRDRAAERRKAFNQPDKPSWHDMQGNDAKKRRFEGPAPVPEPIAAAPPGQDASNVGHKLLSKQGWTQGTGLGQGGRVEPIKVQQFAERAGLGSGVGVEVGASKAEVLSKVSGVSSMQYLGGEIAADR